MFKGHLPRVIYHKAYDVYEGRMTLCLSVSLSVSLSLSLSLSRCAYLSVCLSLSLSLSLSVFLSLSFSFSLSLSDAVWAGGSDLLCLELAVDEDHLINFWFRVWGLEFTV